MGDSPGPIALDQSEGPSHGDSRCLFDPARLGLMAQRAGAGVRLPVLEGRFCATSAYPRIGPVRGEFGAVWYVLAPRVGSDGVDWLPNDLKPPGGLGDGRRPADAKILVGQPLVSIMFDQTMYDRARFDRQLRLIA
jgi:hypothetical protein